MNREINWLQHAYAKTLVFGPADLTLFVDDGFNYPNHPLSMGSGAMVSSGANGQVRDSNQNWSGW